MRRILVFVCFWVGTLAFAEAPPLSVVQAHCAKLSSYLETATGVEQALIAHALDQCQIDVTLLTPPKQSKWSLIGGDVATALAIGQITRAAYTNMDWLEMRKRQKNAGNIEANFSTEIITGSYLSLSLGTRWWHRWKHRKSGGSMGDFVTDSVLLPH